MLQRIAARKPVSPRKGTIRGELVGVVGLAVIACAAVAVLMMGGA